MKKFLCLFTSLLMVVSFCSCSMQKSSPIEDFLYELKDGEATIIGYIGTDLEIVIPSEIEGRPVTKIGYNSDDKKGAFKGYDMTSIVIPEGVEYINEYAFDSCKMLEKISLPDSFKGFYYGDDGTCSGISALDDTKWFNDQPDGVLYIDNIFLGIKGEPINLTTIEIKKGTTSIASNALYGEDDITEVIVPNSVKYIGKRAFYNCDLLNEVTVPDGVVIGENAFNKTIINGKYKFETPEE